VKVYHLSYYTSNPNSTRSIPIVGKGTTPYEEVGVGILKESSLMATFSFPPPIFLHNEA